MFTSVYKALRKILRLLFRSVCEIASSVPPVLLRPESCVLLLVSVNTEVFLCVCCRKTVLLAIRHVSCEACGVVGVIFPALIWCAVGVCAKRCRVYCICGCIATPDDSHNFLFALQEGEGERVHPGGSKEADGSSASPQHSHRANDRLHTGKGHAWV